jgi:polysaccharide export outer membrane protein
MRFNMRSATVLAACALFLACGSAPDPVPTPGPARPEPASLEETMVALKPFLEDRDPDFPLYAGDVIRITVQAHDDLTVERKIPPDGRVPLFKVTEEQPDGSEKPVVIRAIGRRITELEEELRSHYAKTITSPYVTVRVMQYAPKMIYVAGAVKSPGEYQLQDDKRLSLLQALSKAGWFAENAADDRVRILRIDRKTSTLIHVPPIDVGRIVAEGLAEMDILLLPGDTVTVDSRESQSVFIFGEVVQPGEIPFQRDMTLTKLITRVGGLKDFAKLSKIRIMRKRSGQELKVHYVDLDAVFDGEAQDFPLLPGDVVYVDETFI